MTIDEIVKVIDTVSRLLGVLVWPSVMVFMLFKLGPSLRDFLSSLGEFSLKGPGFEASVKRKQAEAAAALAAAGAARFEGTATPEVKAREVTTAARLVIDSVTPQVIRLASRSKILWVDDRPCNNILERHSFEALGVNFALATSTEEALEKLKEEKFDAIISDMGRPPDQQAGYTLLDKLHAAGNQTPFIIYAGSRALEHQAEVRRRGGLGCTNRPDELFKLVLQALRHQR